MIVDDIVAGMNGSKCHKAVVYDDLSLKFFFGDCIGRFVGPRSVVNRYQWEFGTYNAAWRVVSGGEVLCGIRDVSCGTRDPSEIPKMQAKFDAINFGKVDAVEVVGGFDVSVKMANGIRIDFMNGSSESDDEVFFFFYPDHMYLEFSCGSWVSGRSDAPWGEAESV